MAQSPKPRRQRTNVSGLPTEPLGGPEAGVEDLANKSQPAAQVIKSRKSSAPKKQKPGESPPAVDAPAAPPAARAQSRSKARRAPRYLAAELGHPVDHHGEPIGAGSARAQSDTKLQEAALKLWRQMQRGGVLRPQMRSIENAGLTIDEIWAPGLTEKQQTSSTGDDIKRYHQKLLFRANLLEAILSETVAELQRLEGIEPAPSASDSDPG